MRIKTMDGVIVAPKRLLNILAYGYMKMSESHRKDGFEDRADEMCKIAIEINNALYDAGYFNV